MEKKCVRNCGPLYTDLDESATGVPLMYCRDTLGRVPLHYACWWAHAPIVRKFYVLLTPAFGIHPMDHADLQASFVDLFSKNPYGYAANGYFERYPPYLVHAQVGAIGSLVLSEFAGKQLVYDYLEKKLNTQTAFNGAIFTTGVGALDSLQGIVMLAPTSLLIQPCKALFGWIA